MRALENMLAVLCIALLIIVMVSVRSEHYSEYCEITAKSLVESFMAETSASGKITQLSYEVCAARLYEIGYQGDFSITVAEYETAADGSMHRYITTWDEILEVIVSDGVYECPDGSCVKVAVAATDERLSQSFLRAFSGLKGFVTVAYVNYSAIELPSM